MARMVDLDACCATLRAAAKVPPAVMPTNTFLLREILAALHRLGCGDGELVDQVHVDRVAGELGHGRGPSPASGAASTPDAFTGEPSALRSCCAAPAVSIGASAGSQTTILVSGRSFWRTRARFQRSAGAESGHPVVEPLPGEVADDLARRSARVVVGVRLVLELAREEPAVLFGELHGAFFTIPVPRSGAGVMTTLAPRKRMSLRRSTLKLSAMVTTSG